jgi:HEPN domain-containing protein
MDSEKEWLRRAISSLHLATALEGDPGICLEDRCFQLQQSSEKALKALLLSVGLKVPRTHDLVALINLLDSRMDVDDTLRDATELNDYAVHTRYPGDYTPIDNDEYLRAVKIARSVVEWTRIALK